jgi:diguanylate cyclase (GGDEF)-like protein
VLITLMVLGSGMIDLVSTAVTGVISAAAVVVGIRVHRPSRPWVWWLFAVSIAATAIPQKLAPSPSMSDATYLIAAAVTAFGTVGATIAPLMLVRLRAGRRDREGAVDSLILALSIAVVLRQILTSVQQNTIAAPAAMIITLTVIAGLTIAAGIRLMFLAPKALSARLLFVSSVCGQIIGVLIALSNGDDGKIPAMAYVVAGLTRLLVGAAALHPSMAQLTRPDTDRPGVPYGRLLVLCTALPACVVAVFVEAGVDMATSFAGIGVVSVVILVLIRLGGLVREREHARQLQELTARVGTAAIEAGDEDAMVRRTTAELAAALDAEVGVEPVASGDVAFQAELGEGGGVLTVRRRRPLTPDERHCVDTVAVILNGALRRGRSEAAVRHAAVHDSLTGLPNRELLGRRLRDGLAAGVRPGQVSLLFIDLDGFKGVNDRLGHLAGDQVLVQAADRMRAVVGDQGCLARFAGDEFVVLLTGGQDAGALATGLRDCAAAPFHLEAGTASIGASVGIAVHDGAETAEQLLQRADVAMYAAKQDRRRQPREPIPA